MGKITFILGGTRSGKSAYALGLARKHKNVAFIATCQVLDEEMKERIKLHKKSRPKHWQTFEESRDVASMLKKMDNKFDCIVIDCLTLLVSNLLLDSESVKLIESRIEKMLANLKSKNAHALIVSNEVGLGLVPANKLGRDFRDITGKVNQIVAIRADEVFFMASGIPLELKRLK
ncbi:MAG: bifunctional adenosylcobinamide kinase/adenosylcobinamide-phosphate guanylyltransferase [Candidatus Omnitrophota bacterium]